MIPTNPGFRNQNEQQTDGQFKRTLLLLLLKRLLTGIRKKKFAILNF